MSYIRCISNPEGLYVYHDVDGFISLHVSQKPIPLKISLREWFYLKRHYKRYGDENPFIRPTLRVEKCFTLANTNIEYPEPKNWFTNKIPLDNRLRLSIKMKNKWYHIYLWSVTYCYMMDNAIKK